MPVIQSHGVTLRGENGLVLRPLCDDHLPLLYRWNSDPEVLYWCEGDDVSCNDAETVHDIYGRTSQTAFCFLIEKDGLPIGECWLQKQNLPQLIELYPPGKDLRRIDMAIFEKDHWGRGLGTAAFRMLMDFAFNSQGCEVLHAVPADYNTRSNRMVQSCGFAEVLRIPTPDSVKAKEDICYALTREVYRGASRVA